MSPARRIVWDAGAPARLALVGLIRLYRLTLSGWLGGQCRFSPTCSRYAEEAIRTHGATKGVLLATRRVLRCNPFGRGGLDPVPGPRHPYDTTIRWASSRALPHVIRRRHGG
jgi:uncharacterized protein